MPCERRVPKGGFLRDGTQVLLVCSFFTSKKCYFLYHLGSSLKPSHSCLRWLKQLVARIEFGTNKDGIEYCACLNFALPGSFAASFEASVFWRLRVRSKGDRSSTKWKPRPPLSTLVGSGKGWERRGQRQARGKKASTRKAGEGRTEASSHL